MSFPPSESLSLPLPSRRIRWQTFLSTGQSLAICYGVKPICPKDSPLASIKWNLKPLLLTNLKVHKLKSLCTQIWPQYKLDNQNRWPEFGIFYFNILSDVTNFLKQNGKCSEVPCIQDFWNLRSRPSLCKDCSTYQILLFSLPLHYKRIQI